MALGAIRGAWSLARRVEELFEFQIKAREGFQLIDERLKALEGRILRLEAEQGQVITAAGAAATAAAATVAGIGDLRRSHQNRSAGGEGRAIGGAKTPSTTPFIARTR